MFSGREYQIKDIMEAYSISRDTIKYYEQAGLIESHRKENGYRVFDELNMRKLKKILSFRSLGMTIEEITAHCDSETAQARMEALITLRLRTEQELRELHQKLDKIRSLERSASANPRFANGFNADRGATLCVDCPHISDKHLKSFTVISGATASFTEMQKICDVKDCWLVFNKEVGEGQCANCSRKLYFEEYYRARIPYVDKEKIERQLKTAYNDLALQGIQLERNIYMMKKVIRMDGKDVLILDTIIPVKKD